jgi:hypothetical protein
MDSRSEDFRGEPLPDWLVAWLVAIEDHHPQQAAVELTEGVFAEEPASDVISDAD